MAHIVQKVSTVKWAKKRIPETSPKKAVERLLTSNVEACSQYQGKVIACEYHPLVTAVAAAYAEHRPLALSPDMFWLLIVQGLARHINQHAEEMRSRFVSHAGKETIQVRRDDFIKGSPENPWSDVFTDFSEAIRAKIGDDNHANIVATFSTTGPIEKAANEVVLMDAMKSYFEYEFVTLCGIPQVILEGEPRDWQHLKERTESLSQAYDLDRWIKFLIPILDRIAENAAGADDPDLWKDIFKVEGGSGGPYINGWLIDFFPYVETNRLVEKQTQRRVNWNEPGVMKDFEGDRQFYDFAKVDEPNPFLGRRSAEEEFGGGLTTPMFPGSLSRVPFRWKYLAEAYEMEFVAGFTAFTQDHKTLAVRPKIGWAVGNVTESR